MSIDIERGLMLAQGESPYGMTGGETGEHALGLLENLLTPKTPMPFKPGETPRWDDTDIEAFDYVMELDGDMRCIDPTFEEGTVNTGETHRAWQPLELSLPFSEGERRWLIQALRKPSGNTHKPSVRARYPNAFLPTEATVVSGGIRQQVEGRDLVRRWASWRRETDEFADQGNITRAIFLLDHLAYELVPQMFTTPGFRTTYPQIGEFDDRVRPDAVGR
ncbi:MAG: hypothetical protein WA484_16865 [Solirubrobacteraceae bacterium]